MIERTVAERLATLEAHYEQLLTSQDRVEGKIDDLIELKNKGMGAFWFVSAILSSGVLASFAWLFTWFTGKH